MVTSTLFGGLRRRLDGILGLVQTRLELLEVEVQQEKLRVARLIWMTVLAALGIGASVVFAVIWLTVLLWDQHRLLVLGLSVLLCLGLGLAAATAAARTLSSPSTLFAASLAELRRDRHALMADRRDRSAVDGDSDGV